MTKVMGNIELYMGPHQLDGPDNLQEVIVNFIDGAQKRLLIAVQELDSKPIAEAIIRAKQRKVLVKLVLEADYLLYQPGHPVERREYHHSRRSGFNR